MIRTRVQKVAEYFNKNKETDQGPVVAIDLGTSKVVVGVLQDGKFEVIENEYGNRSTPCFVSFDKKVSVGDDAKRNASNNIENTVYQIKRLIGRSYDDVNKENWDFKIVNIEGKLQVKVQLRSEEVTLHPEEILARIISKMKKIAENKIGMPVTKAVISKSSSSQEMAIQSAAIIAGFKDVLLIDETLASAYAYADKSVKKELKHILVFDLGAGYLKVCVCEVTKKKKVEVIKTDGGEHLGGDDFDAELVKHFVGKIKSELQIDIENNRRYMFLLRKKCEEAKILLSDTTTVETQVYFPVEQKLFKIKITREEFDDLCKSFYDRITETLETVKSYLEATKIQISEFVLVGGASRIPKVQEILLNVFRTNVNIKLNLTLNANEAVVTGAAIYGKQKGVYKDLNKPTRGEKIGGQQTDENKKLSEMIKRARDIEDKEKELKNKQQTRNYLENDAYFLKHKLENSERGNLTTDEQNQKVLKKCDDILEWINNNTNANKEEYIQKNSDLLEVLNELGPTPEERERRRARHELQQLLFVKITTDVENCSDAIGLENDIEECCFSSGKEYFECKSAMQSEQNKLVTKTEVEQSTAEWQFQWTQSLLEYRHDVLEKSFAGKELGESFNEILCNLFCAEQESNSDLEQKISELSKKCDGVFKEHPKLSEMFNSNRKIFLIKIPTSGANSEMKEDDLKERKRRIARHNLEKLLFEAIDSINRAKDIELYCTCIEMENWIEKNLKENQEEFEEKYGDLEILLSSEDPQSQTENLSDGELQYQWLKSISAYRHYVHNLLEQKQTKNTRTAVETFFCELVMKELSKEEITRKAANLQEMCNETLYETYELRHQLSINFAYGKLF